MKKTLHFIWLILTIFYANTVFATHNRSGEIIYEQIDSLTIRATIITYTKISSPSNQADRPELDLNWGDATHETVPRTSYVDFVQADYRINKYTATHTYPGLSPSGLPFILSMQDPNRNENILNINGGNSVNIEFLLYAEVILFPTSVGYNSSAVPLVPAIDIGYIGHIFQHTPGAIDFDGDSVAYELITPLSDLGVPVTSYQAVTDIGPGANNTYTLDVSSGRFTWDAPQIAGTYNIAFAIKSYRGGVYMGMVMRDLQIIIINQPAYTPSVDTFFQHTVVIDSVSLDTLDFEWRVFNGAVGLMGNTHINFYGPDFIMNDANITIQTINTQEKLVRFRYVPQAQRPEYDLNTQVTMRISDSYELLGGSATYDFIRFKWLGRQDTLIISQDTIQNVKPVSKEIVVNVFPIPANDVLNIETDKLYENITLRIFDDKGALQYKSTLNEFTGTLSLPVDRLQNGTYYLHLQNDADKIVRKIIVAKGTN